MSPLPPRLQLSILLLGPALIGCGEPGAIAVDLSSTPVRLIINHQGWPRPFWWPRVTEFAIANDRDELVWQLASTDPAGLPAHQLAFVYGRVSPGFHQLFPVDAAPPPPLRPGRSYYVAAGGPRSLYRMVFSLPQDPAELLHSGKGRTSGPRESTVDPNTPAPAGP